MDEAESSVRKLKRGRKRRERGAREEEPVVAHASKKSKASSSPRGGAKDTGCGEARDGGSKRFSSGGADPIGEKAGTDDGMEAPDGGSKGIRSSGIVVAHTPNLPSRYEYLLKLMTFLVPCESPGKAYVCSANRIETFLRQKKCDLGLFFEWVRTDRKMLCWVFNRRTRVEFLVNPAFSCEFLQVRVERAACSFSLNFCCDETWATVKEILEMMFCPPHCESSEAPDHLYVFTRINDCVYFRNMKIGGIPAIASEEAFVLKEVEPYFCLKLVDIHGENDVSSRASDVPQSQIESEQLSLTPTVYYSLSPALGSSMVHCLSLNCGKYLILLENGHDLSVFEGYNVSLREFLEEEPFLKTKYIIGSKTREEWTFARNIAKSIIRSILSSLIELFSCDKCINMETQVLDYTKILLKGSSVKFYGVELVKFEDKQAEQNVLLVVQLIRGCFPARQIPVDLKEIIQLLQKAPLQYLKMAKGDSSLQSAKCRRDMLIRLHTEYLTNVKPKLSSGDDGKDNCNKFFLECPYVDSWINTCERNMYLRSVANYNPIIKSLKAEKKGKEDDIEPGEEGQRAELQFSVMRNSDVHIPEKAVEDGITPFRLAWTDYIRTAHFPRYLAFIQRRMAQYQKSKL